MNSVRKIYIVLEDLRSLYNIGAIFRTCSFFGFTKLILLGYSGKTWNHEGKRVLHNDIKKSSLGSENDLDIIFIETVDEFREFVKSNNLKIVSIEQSPDALLLSDFKCVDDIAVIFGNEAIGISKDLLAISDYIVEIPKVGTHNSLNVTTTCGIILHHLVSN